MDSARRADAASPSNATSGTTPIVIAGGDGAGAARVLHHTANTAAAPMAMTDATQTDRGPRSIRLDTGNGRTAGNGELPRASTLDRDVTDG